MSVGCFQASILKPEEVGCDQFPNATEINQRVILHLHAVIEALRIGVRGCRIHGSLNLRQQSWHSVNFRLNLIHIG